MIRFSLLLLLPLFLTLTVNAQQARSVKHVHSGKVHTHVLPNNGKGRHSHGRSRANVNRKGQAVKHAHNGKLHWHALPNNGRGKHGHSHRGAAPNRNNPSRASRYRASRRSQEPATHAATFQQKSMYVDASRLHVRNLPNKKGKVVWQLKRDQKVQVTNKDGNWLYIENSRFKGWVYGTYLTRSPTPKQARAPEKQKKIVKEFSTTEIKKILINRSLSDYPGNCPCPENRANNGSRCGKRSAWSRPGGRSPLCYESDITAQMVSRYKERL